VAFRAADLAESLERSLPAAASGLVAAVSGGLDSSCLLAALAALPLRLPLRAVHIDHGLQTAAGAFRDHVQRLCGRLGVPLAVIGVTVDALPGASLEAAAREARYAALAAQLRPGECLLTAHTRDDQAETFLLQALRGAGPRGLASMPPVRELGAGWQLRPLLEVTRDELQDFAAEQGVAAVTDPMNQDLRFDRVYLRAALWPALLQRWPGAVAGLARAAGHSAEAQQQLERQADLDLVPVRDGAALSVRRLRRLPQARQLQLLRRWSALAGALPPSTARLDEALRQMLDARADHLPVVAWGEHALRRYRDRIFLTPAQLPRLQGTRAWDWRREPTLALGQGLGSLRAVERPDGLATRGAPGLLEVRPRAGGERLRPAAAGRTQTLQHLCQAHGVLPWMRDALPLIYRGDALVAVADLWLCAAPRAAAGEAGLAFVWDQSPSLS
jgi:tRNA(Ile)-lysidine synthase